MEEVVTMKLALVGSVCVVLGLSMGCSDPPALPAQGAASIFLQPRSGTGSSCPSSTTIAEPIEAGPFISCNPAAGTCEPGKEVDIDGDGADVACQISKRADGYALSGSFDKDDKGFAFSFSTPALVSETGGIIAVSVRKALEDVPMQDANCTLTLHAIEKTSMWGTYTCPNIGESAAPQPICTASGSFVFENCGT